MQFLILSLVAAAQTGGVLNQPWPEVKPPRALVSPDWSDYRIYPKAALDKEQQGKVQAESFVGTDGIPKACRIVVSSGFNELDAGTCNLFMQMRFEPARDSNGKPIESHYEAAVTWRFADPVPFTSGTVKARMEVQDNQMVSCATEGSEGPYASLWASAACSYLTDVRYFLGPHSVESTGAIVEVRLDAADNSPVLQSTALAGTPVAIERVSFKVDAEGAPIDCIVLEKRGFGPRGIRTMSPCGPFLADLYFAAPPEQSRQPRQGVIETRVYLTPRMAN